MNLKHPIRWFLFILCLLLILQAGHQAEPQWLPDNKAKLETFLSSSFQEGEVAVFDADGTLWKDDVGEAFLRWLIAEKKLIGVDYSQDIYAGYEKMCQTEGNLKCYGYAVQLMKGLRTQDVQAWSDVYFQNHFVDRIFPLQQQLVTLLETYGMTVWIVSASHQWIVEAGADVLGIPREHVIGIRLEEENGLLTDRLVQPITYRQGKVDAINQTIQKQPLFVSGNSMTDYEMLQYSKGLRLVINPKDEGPLPKNLAQLAQLHGWLIQRW